MQIPGSESLLQFLYPPVCPGCGEPGLDDLLCGGCRLAVAFLPLAESWRAGDDRLPLRWAACRHAGPARDLLLRVKYAADSHPLPALAALLGQAMDPGAFDLVAPACVVPMPLSRGRRRTRGFNQVLPLARVCAERLGVELACDALVRVGAAAPQVGRSAEERRRLGRCMRARRVGERSVVLVDDVETTGATLAEGSRALLDAGAREVVAVTLCRAPDPTG